MIRLPAALAGHRGAPSRRLEALRGAGSKANLTPDMAIQLSLKRGGEKDAMRLPAGGGGGDAGHWNALSKVR